MSRGFYKFVDLTDFSRPSFALFVLIGVLGDLTASIIKRQCGIKDFGNIIPGHGGIMDRFDSNLMIAPALYWLVTYFPLVK